MKTISNLILMLMLAAMVSCGSEKAVSGAKVQGLQEVSTPCEGPEFESNETAFRATGNGTSPNESFAKKQALADARQLLASQIELTVKGMFDNYASQYDIGNQQEFKQKSQDITRQVVNAKLVGTKTVCSKKFMTPNGAYKYYICIEMPVENIGKSIYDNINKEEKLKLDYDYEKFKDELQKEIEGMNN